MSKIFTNSFKTRIIDALLAYNPYFYVFLSKPTPFADDSVPPSPQDSVNQTRLDGYADMITVRNVQTTDASYMIPRFDWQSGVGYKAYRDTSGDLYGNNFYVSVSSGSGYDVFKCLSNNDTISTAAPTLNATSPSDDIYETSDGYQWKYMYSISNSDFAKFATRDYIPVATDPDVSGNAVSGSIDYIHVDYGGSNYDGFTSGTIQSVGVGGNNLVYVIESSASSNSNFYTGSAIKITSGTGAGQQRSITGYSVSGSTRTVVIDSAFTTTPTTTSRYEITPSVMMVGGGQDFQARALVNAASSNSIYKIEIINRGSGYRYGRATISGNTGGVNNTAILTTVISPYGGHGYDAVKELGGKYLCLTTTFDSTDTEANTKMISTNDFRTIGVMVDPVFANIALSYTSATGNFIDGETIVQANNTIPFTSNITGTVVSRTSNTLFLTNVTSNFIAAANAVNYITGQTSGVQAQVTAVRNNNSDILAGEIQYANMTTRVQVSNFAGSFVADETVTMTGNTATSNAVVYYVGTSELWLTNVKGPVGSVITSVGSGSTAAVSSVTPPDIIPGSGDLLYIENISPINRTPGQTETIKAIIEF